MSVSLSKILACDLFPSCLLKVSLLYLLTKEAFMETLSFRH